MEQAAADFSRQQQEQFFANPTTTGNNTFMPGYRAVSQQPVWVSTPQTNQSSAYRTLDNVANSIDQINAIYNENINARQQQLANQQLMPQQQLPSKQEMKQAQRYSAGIPVGGLGKNEKIDYSTLGRERQKVLSNAQSYVGSPYVLGGVTKQGIDCSGLVMNVYNKAGFNVTQHNATWQGQNIPGVRTTIDNLRPGDLVAWRDGSHIAIYAGNGKIIEAANPTVGTVQRPIWADPSQIFGIKLRLPGDNVAAHRAALISQARAGVPADRLAKENAPRPATPRPTTSTVTIANKKTAI